jgi:hypothetical protein
VLLGCGCSSGRPESASITRADLPAMMLPKSALGARALSMHRGRLSGPFSNAKRAASDLDPRDTTAAFTALGRITGYGDAYQVSDSAAEQALRTGKGLLVIDTLVELYRSSADVSRQMQRSVTDLHAFVGKPVKAGATLIRDGTFAVPNVGDAADGITPTFRFQGFRIYYTVVDVRLGRVLASVTEGRADDKDVRADAVALAKKLAARVRRVAAGKS